MRRVVVSKDNTFRSRNLTTNTGHNFRLSTEEPHTSPPTPTEPTELSARSRNEIASLVAECVKLLQEYDQELTRLYQQRPAQHPLDHQALLLRVSRLLGQLEHHAKIPDLSGLESIPLSELGQTESEPSGSAKGGEREVERSRTFEEEGEWPDQLWPKETFEEHYWQRDPSNRHLWRRYLGER